MATYRMLVTDLDGTLLNREAKLSERNKAAVRRAVEKGIPIVLCSGRFPAEGLADFGRELGLDVPGNYYICGNGALLVDAAALAIVEGNYLPLSSAAELIRRAEAFPPELQPEQIHICTPKGFYCREPAGDRFDFIKPYGMEVRVFSEDLHEVQGEVGKMRFVANRPGFAENFVRAMEPYCPADALGYIMPPFLGEYVGIHAQKGYTVGLLAKRLGIPMEEVICVGDSYNDLSMLKAAGLGISVRNGENLIRREADLVFPFTNAEDAVGRIIEEYLL